MGGSAILDRVVPISVAKVRRKARLRRFIPWAALIALGLGVLAYLSQTPVMVK